MKTAYLVTPRKKSIKLDLIDFLKENRKIDGLVPTGFYTAKEISNRINLCQSKTCLKLQKLKKDNKVEVLIIPKLFNNSFRLVPHYRLTNTQKF